MLNKIIIIIALIFIGCSNSNNTQTDEIGINNFIEDKLIINEEQEILFFPNRSGVVKQLSSTSVNQKTKIIKSGSLKFEVTHLIHSKKKVDQLLKSYNSYYENEKYNSYGNKKSYALILKIPAIQFDSVIMELENGFGKMTAKNINATDVSEEYNDLGIRLSSNKAYFIQYHEILKKAKTIKEILEVQEKIRNLEEEMERKKARIQYLDNKVKYSTLNLELCSTNPIIKSKKAGFIYKIKKAFKNGINGFLHFIIALVNFWPFLVFTFILWLFRKSILAKFSRK